MTYCLGIKTKEGLIAISDTRISSGTGTSNRKKISFITGDRYALFLMTSGLRSIRDKAVHYLDETISKSFSFDKLYKIVNAFGDIIKRIASEDQEILQKAGYKFNINAIIGGQLEGDEEHKLFLVYSEGNWIEIGHGSPYVVIGNTSHGKGILNRILSENSSLEQALKAGFISFDSTRIVSNDVEFPIDVIVYKKDSFKMNEERFETGSLAHVSESWNQNLQRSVDEMPNDWIKKLI